MGSTVRIQFSVLIALSLICLGSGCRNFPMLRQYTLNPEASDTPEASNATTGTSQPADAQGVEAVQLPSGLKYRVIQSGRGQKPLPSSVVRVHYEGRLPDGTVFDSSLRRGEPAEFPVQGVIAGCTEALLLMKVGDKWQLEIPSELAYGTRGAGAKIGPNQDLIFDVELLAIK